MDLREQLRLRAHEIQARRAPTHRTLPNPGAWRPEADDELRRELAKRAHALHPVRCDYSEERLKAEILEMRAARGLVKVDEDGDPIPEPLGPSLKEKLGPEKQAKKKKT